MVEHLTQWNGTKEQLKRLTAAIASCCTCENNKPMCEAHKMLTDQRVMDHLAYVDRTKTLYTDGEQRK